MVGNNIARGARRGFIVAELLVTIAILGILAGLLLPTFSQVREKARQAVCMSRLEQLHRGLMLYVQDWDGWMPAIGNIAGLRWRNRLHPYIGMPTVWGYSELYVCPSYEKEGTYEDYMQICMYHHLAGGPETSRDYLIPKNISLIRKRDTTPAFLDGIPGTDGYDGITYSPPEKVLRHNKGINIIFMDGHTEWQKAKSETSFSFGFPWQDKDL